jgi:hypothetical protein
LNLPALGRAREFIAAGRAHVRDIVVPDVPAGIAAHQLASHANNCDDLARDRVHDDNILLINEVIVRLPARIETKDCRRKWHKIHRRRNRDAHSNIEIDT